MLQGNSGESLPDQVQESLRRSCINLRLTQNLLSRATRCDGQETFGFMARNLRLVEKLANRGH
jgi:hypothetical protein